MPRVATDAGTSRAAGSDVQPWKALSPTEVTVPGTSTEASLPQPPKSPVATRTEPSASLAEERPEPAKGPSSQGVPPSVDSSEAGSSTKESEGQPEKALAPRRRTPSESPRGESEAQPSRAWAPTKATDPGSSTKASEAHLSKYPSHHQKRDEKRHKRGPSGMNYIPSIRFSEKDNVIVIYVKNV